DGWTTIDQDRKWVVSGWAGVSRVHGNPVRMQSLQESSVHYFQRPDADYLGVDSSRTSLSGYAGRISLNKQKGNWMFNSALGAVSPGFEVNDLGFQSRADQINAHIMFGHKWTQPGRLTRNWRLNVASFRTYDFSGDLTWYGYFLTGAFELNNFSTGKWYLAYNPPSWSDRRTRGGPLTLNPSGVEWDFQMDSDPNKRWNYGLALHGTDYRLDSDKTWSIKGALEWKAG